MTDLKPHLDIGDGTRREAAERLARTFREGLDNAVSIPEVCTEAEEVTHAILGCIWHTTMMILRDTVEQIPEGVPDRVRDNVNSVINSKLYNLALMAVNRGAPIGPSDRCG